MKLTWKQIDPFIKLPDPKARVVLIYGPDDGLMRERARMIGKTVTPDLDDPFNVTTLTIDQLNETPSLLNDEANALSMMGGVRLIRISSGSDKITIIVKNYLEDPSPDNLVIIEAGDLGTRSSLRQLCEKAKNAVALPCYIEDERGITNMIRQTLSEAGYKIDADALHFFASAITGDRARARSEIEKLMLYMGNPAEHNFIKLDDVKASCGSVGNMTMDDLVYAVAGGQSVQSLLMFHKLLSEGIAEIAILRSLQNHFYRLHQTQSWIESGLPTDQAIKKLQPPLFFKLESLYKSHLIKWKGHKLELILQKLNELEAQTKQSGTAVQTLCAQAILSFSAMR